MNEQQKKTLSHLQAQCARREYCRNDVFAKALKDLDGDEAAANELTAALVNEGYVDDLRYASAFAADRANLTGWGPVKIRFALLAKGIEDEIVAEALNSVDPGTAEAKLESMLAAKYRSTAEDPDCKLKLIKFALAKGYNYNDVREAVNKLVTGDK